MNAVSRLPAFEERWAMPTLVLVDIHNDHPPAPETDSSRRDFLAALEKCALALEHARRQDLPVAFVRYMQPPPSLLANRAYPSWIGDIRPRRSDMVFERALPSCYASRDFAEMAQRSGGLVLAGLFGETSCLSTLMEGYARGHVFTFLADASVSRELRGIPADVLHRSVTGIASIYSEISSTQAWLDRTETKVGTGG